MLRHIVALNLRSLRVVRGVSEYAENADKWNENFLAPMGINFRQATAMLALF